MMSCSLRRGVGLALFVCQFTLGFTLPAISDRTPSPEEVGFLPLDADRVSVNPPPLAWLEEKNAASYEVQIATEPGFSKPLVDAQKLKYLLYTHTSPLDPGRYFWRYRYLGADAQCSEWSRIRSFEVPPEATRFARPSADYIQKTVPRSHPRMFTRPEELASLRASTTRMPREWKSLLAAADRALSTPLMKEPAPWSGGKGRNIDEWRSYLKQIGPATTQMETLAFVYLLSGEKRYGLAARQRLMDFMLWNPAGPSSCRVNDEVGMPLLYSCSRTYSWIHDLLSPEDIAKVQKVMHTRGSEAYHMLRQPHHAYEQFAYDSHAGRMWHFLGEAGLAFYGEIPEASEWLDYALTIFYGWYPIWGDPQDGGWAEGTAYWSSYNNRITWWLDQMQLVLKVNGTDKPFYSHVGDFALYVCPPGGVLSGFGDFSERPPFEGMGNLVGAYALAKQNPVWQWYAQKFGGSEAWDPVRYLRAMRKKPAPQPPADDSILKLFTRAGFAVFNSSLTRPKNNVQFMLRCSSYGNISHSHDDQNNVVLSAYGEPLLVNTGVRDYYGSEFCKQWYWTSRAHNCLLVGGKGQVRGPLTKGQILGSGTGKDFAWVVGDATGAYGDNVSLYRRWVAYVRDEAIVMLDEVQTTQSSLELLFHGRSPFEASSEQQGFSLTQGKASLQGWVYGPGHFGFEQIDQYPLQPGNKVTTCPEWHLSAKLTLPAESSSRPLGIVTVLVPYRKDNEPPISRPVVEPGEHLTHVLWNKDGHNRRIIFDRTSNIVKMQ